MLVDPHTIIERPELAPNDRSIHWADVVSLAANHTIQLGHESFHWIVKQLQATGFPAQMVNFGPEGFGRDCQVALEQILSRVSRGSQEAVDSEIVPSYILDGDARLSLILDATEHADVTSALYTKQGHWSEPSTTAAFGSVRYDLIEDPTFDESATAQARSRLKVESMSLHVVGGAPTPSALRKLEEELGIPTDRVSWTRSEKAKPPRDMDRKWGSLDPKKDLALCITGRVSHAVWEQCEKAAASCGVRMLECATQGRIVETIQAWGCSDELQ